VNTLLIVSTFVAGLLFDQHVAGWGQAAIDAWVWMLFAFLVVRAEPRDRMSLLICLAYATAGEIFLSLVWGLYEYRQHNIPLFVPPGHAMLFLLGTQAARKMPAWGPWIVIAGFGAYTAYAVFSGGSTVDLLLFGMFLACFFVRRGRSLYAAMIVLALMLELLGTGIGNWVWASQVPVLGLSSSNPPALAGAFYCVLDLLVVATLARMGMRQIALDSGPSQKLH
jgi:hypothetical protein